MIDLLYNGVEPHTTAFNIVRPNKITILSRERGDLARENALHSGDLSESLAQGDISLPPIPIGSLLAFDTTRRPRHGRKALCADL